MANVKFTKPQHIGRLFYSYWDGSAWSAHVEITDTFLNDTTKNHSGSVSGLASLSDNLTEKDRFIMYYGSYVNGVWTPASGTLDCIALANMSQISGLTLYTYADDSIDIGSVPTTLIDTHVQSAGSGLYSTKSELIEFTETTKECFMVERQGIAGYDAGTGVNLIQNPLFLSDDELTDPDNWSKVQDATYGNAARNDTGRIVGGQKDLSLQVTTALAVPTSAYAAWYQNVGLVTSEDQDFKLTATVLQAATTEINPVDRTVGHIQVGTSAIGGEIYEGNVKESDDGGTLELSFSTTSGDSLTYVGFITEHTDGGGAAYLTTVELDSLTLEATTGSTYKGQPIDTAAIIFGGDALQPTRNFENGQQQDDSNKWAVTITNNRSYQTKTNSVRKDTLQFELFSDTQKQLLQDLDKELVEGLCIYQRDGDSTDDNEWFVGRFMLEPNTAQFTDLNSIRASVTELEARE